MSRAKLDRVDLSILRDLQENGRMTNVELAKNAGISAPPCLRRVRALEEKGYIRGYHAALDPAKMGYPVTVFAQVELHYHNEADLRAFSEKVAQWPLVRESYMLAGDVDFLFKIVAPDWETYQHFLTHELTATKNVDHVKTLMTVGVTKQAAGVPLEG